MHKVLRAGCSRNFVSEDVVGIEKLKNRFDTVSRIPRASRVYPVLDLVNWSPPKSTSKDRVTGAEELEENMISTVFGTSRVKRKEPYEFDSE